MVVLFFIVSNFFFKYVTGNIPWQVKYNFYINFILNDFLNIHICLF